MRLSRWISVAALSLLFVLGPVGIAEAQTYEPEEQQFLELINDYRLENGLEPLLLSDPLSVASERHSDDMGTYGFFSHTTEASSYYPVGSDHTDRIAQEGYDYNTYTAENLAYGHSTAAAVFEGWRTSPDHNINMLGDYKVIGIGLAWVNGTPYWTTEFGAYVDPSATGGTAGERPPDNPAPEPTPNSSNVQTPQRAVNAIEQDTPEPTEQRAGKRGIAAREQYASKQTADRLSSSSEENQFAAADQYKEENALQSSEQEDTSASAPPPDEAEQAEGSAEAAGISMLPDTGGIPLSLLGGAGLLAVGLIGARRAFR